MVGEVECQECWPERNDGVHQSTGVSALQTSYFKDHYRNFTYYTVYVVLHLR